MVLVVNGKCPLLVIVMWRCRQVLALLVLSGVRRQCVATCRVSRCRRGRVSPLCSLGRLSSMTRTSPRCVALRPASSCIRLRVLLDRPRVLLTTVIMFRLVVRVLSSVWPSVLTMFPGSLWIVDMLMLSLLVTVLISLIGDSCGPRTSVGCMRLGSRLSSSCDSAAPLALILLASRMKLFVLFRLTLQMRRVSVL